LSEIPTYYNNPFVDCLHKYNNFLLNPILEVSFPNKALAVAKKILLVVAAPFAYVGVGFVAVLTYPVANWRKIKIETASKPNPNLGKKITKKDSDPESYPIKDILNERLNKAIKAIKKEVTTKGLTSYEKINFNLKTQKLLHDENVVIPPGKNVLDILESTAKLAVDKVINVLNILPACNDKINIDWKISLIGKYMHNFDFQFMKHKNTEIVNKTTWTHIS
jgi:hypothetical protein